MSRKAKIFLIFLTGLLAVEIVGLGCWLYYKNYRTRPRVQLLPLIMPGPMRMSRPYGMAPVAFDAYIRACYRTGIHPNRVGQTIGDHPRSVGYHKRDGVLTVGNERIDYCAAVDLGVFDLNRDQIDRLLHELAKQGFACWYRHGGKWTGGEHIHAVYAFLPMKRQLRRQVRKFLTERREMKLRPLAWEAKLRRYSTRLYSMRNFLSTDPHRQAPRG